MTAGMLPLLLCGLIVGERYYNRFFNELFAE